MSFSILGILAVFLVFVSLLLALFVLTVKTTNKRANSFLGAYFLIFAIHISVFFYSRYITLPAFVEMLRDHIAFLTSPLLFLYVLSSIYSDFKLRPKHLLHLAPFILQLALFSPRFYFVDVASRISLLANLNDTLEGKVSIVFGLGVTLFYLITIFLELKRYKQLLLGNYSNKATFNYKWLFQLLVLLSIVFCFSLFKQVYKFYGTNVEILNDLRLTLTIVVLCFLTWIVLKSMYQPDLFRNITSGHVLMNGIEKGSGVDINSNKNISRLLAFIEKEEPYCDPSLTLQQLAKKVNLSSRAISVLINQHLGQHYFDFINGFRVRKAKHMLLVPGNEKLTIQQIMYDVGFSSKSSFYTAFKKHTGLTPSEYRKTKRA